MNLFLILIPQSLNSQFLNLAPYSHYDDDGVQKSDLVFRSNNEVWIYVIASNDETTDHLETLFETESLTDQELYHDLSERLDKLGKKLNLFIKSVNKSHISEK